MPADCHSSPDLAPTWRAPQTSTVPIATVLERARRDSGGGSRAGRWFEKAPADSTLVTLRDGRAMWMIGYAEPPPFPLFGPGPGFGMRSRWTAWIALFDAKSGDFVTAFTCGRIPTLTNWADSSHARLEREGADMRRVALLATAAVVLAVIGGIVVREVLAPRSSAGTLAIGGRDLPELVRASDVVVIGTVMSAGGTRVVSRDPKDPTREDPNYVSVAQDYAFAVESSIKGDAAGTITVAIGSSSHVKRDPFWYEFKNERVPPRVGVRYALFLRRLAWDASVYVLSFEPSQFELGTTAVVRSMWREAKTYFPDRPVPEFLDALRDAARSSSASPPAGHRTAYAAASLRRVASRSEGLLKTG
jgi:hypothetical protein